MKATTEVEIKIGGRITSFKEIGEGTYRFVIETEVPDKEEEVTIDTQDKEQEIATDVQDEVFVLVEASKLSLDDEFMKHMPMNEREEILKEGLTEVIRGGIEDFYRPKYDPSFNEDGTGVTFKAGNKPAVGRSYNWWKNVAKEFMPERHSRLGTKSEYVAFLGVLIKKLVKDEKWSVAKAWDAVCNNSKELGHYQDSEDAKHKFEDTGMREICGFFDLANTCKILAKEEYECTGTFWMVSGYCENFGRDYPLAYHDRIWYNIYNNCNLSVGWFVLS